MSELNVITACFPCGEKSAVTEKRWQWSYGQILKFQGIPDLPDVFNVHFSGQPSAGTAKSWPAQNAQVEIPNEYLETGGPVYAWIFLHEGEEDGETVYDITIPVKRRPQPTDEPITPTQQSAIDTAIAILQSSAATASEQATIATEAAETATNAVDAVTEAARNAAQSALLASNAATSAQTAQRAAEQSATDAETARRTAGDFAEAANASAIRAEDSANDAAVSAVRAATADENAQAAKTAAEASASEAAQSATQASGSATQAALSASNADSSATHAAQFAISAQTAKTDAETARTGAETAQGKAEDAQTAAETAKTNAAGSATQAAASAASVAASAAQITTNTTDITNLKSHLEAYTGIEPITWTQGAYIGLSGSTANIDNPTTNTTWMYAVVPCTEGDRFTVNAAGGLAPRAYGFLDASKNVLTSAIANETVTNTVLIAPKTSAYLVLNNKKESASENFVSYKNQFLTSRIEDTESIIGYNQQLKFNVGANIPLGSYSIGDTVSLTPSSVATYRYCIFLCDPGDAFLLNCKGGINPRAWAFLDANNKLLAVANENVTAVNLYLVAPANTAKIIVNDNNTGGVCALLSKFKKLEYSIDALDPRLDAMSDAINYSLVADKREQLYPIPEDVVCSFVRGYEFADEMTTPIMDFAKPGDLMVHVSTFAIINGVVYGTYYANTRHATETPSEHTARFVKATLSNPSDMTWTDLQDVGETYDGKTVDAIYDTILMQKDSDTLMLMWTAMLNGVYHRLYKTYTISTGVFSATQYNYFYNGGTGGIWNTTNMISALSGIDHKAIIGDIGIMQKLSSRMENGTTWYYTGAYAGYFNCIIKSQDLITWYFVAAPDFENDSEFENATYVINNKVFYFVRQTAKNNTGFLTYYDLTTQTWAEPVFINDCQSRSDFLYFGGVLYLFHAPKDRNHISIMIVNKNALNRSYDLKTAKVPDYFYPFTLIYNDQAYISVTASRQHIYLFRYTLIGKSNDTIIGMIKNILT